MYKSFDALIPASAYVISIGFGPDPTAGCVVDISTQPQ